MVFLLDGYNIFFKLIKTSSVTENHNDFIKLKDRFVTLLADYFRKRKQKAICFLDGGGENWIFERKNNFSAYFQVVYSGGKTADSMIIDYLKQDKFPHNLMVVTEDNEILRAARLYKCKIKRSTEFISEVPALILTSNKTSGRHIRGKISTRKKKKIDKPTKDHKNYTDIENEFRNISMQEILEELADEDGVEYQ